MFRLAETARRASSMRSGVLGEINVLVVQQRVAPSPDAREGVSTYLAHDEIDAMRLICLIPTLAALIIHPSVWNEAWAVQIRGFAKSVIPDVQILEADAGEFGGGITRA